MMAARARRIARSREEMMGLLADFSAGGGEEEDSDRELSFSDLVEAIGPPEVSEAAAELRREEEDAVASAKRRQQQAAAAMAGKEARRLRRRRSNGRGDGVLLNFYVPGLLSRSMTAPRSGRGAMPTAAAAAASAAGHGAPARASAGKSRMQSPLAIGCWPALWGRGRDPRNKPV